MAARSVLPVLQMSQLYAPTLREDPGDAELASHKLMLRAAMMRKVAAGVYSFLPLGLKVLRKVEQIVRDEMDAVGCQEMLMSIIQPGELWKQSGRWDDYGAELFRLNDRHDNVFALSPTQEELITSLLRGELRSYRELPKSFYHIQWKYRDEIRPRFGLMRAREFLMKDAYSFHSNLDSLREHYDEQAYAYGRICERLGLRYVAVEADSGQIGGKVTMEFMALADSGEAEIVHCKCGYAANTEVAATSMVLQAYDGVAGAGAASAVAAGAASAASTACATTAGAVAPTAGAVAAGTASTVAAGAVAAGTPAPLTEIHTPIDGSIPELAAFLGIPTSATVKALAGKSADGQVYVLFIPGNHELGDVKVSKAIDGFEFLNDEEIITAGLIEGFIGPVALPAGIKVIADNSLQQLPHWLTGANKADYHVSGATLGRDFDVDGWADLAAAQLGDLCPECGELLTVERGIEVGHVFQLGTKYSDSMDAKYMDEDGVERPFIMGCYGWGVTRSMAAVVEQMNDEFGIAWPISIAPAEVCIIPLGLGDDLEKTARLLADELSALGIEVAIDDRDERAGVKFADADLIGWPYQIVVGARSLAEGYVELKQRNGMVKSNLAVDEAVASMVQMIEADRARYY
ncbi:MAG: proline--tRNA ligase [Coriobacteriia bacterium]|nr:proline--tRNA ligase [Coriobacteriia bacterium]